MGLGGGSLDAGRREVEGVRMASGEGCGCCVAGEPDRVGIDRPEDWRAGVTGGPDIDGRVVRDGGRED